MPGAPLMPKAPLNAKGTPYGAGRGSGFKKMNNKFEAFKTVIEDNRNFVLTSHVHTDGDALGSLMALRQYLVKLNKKVDIFVPGAIPEKYQFLDADRFVNQLSPAQTGSAIAGADVIIIVDISALDRLAGYHEMILSGKAYKVCIDHHPINDALLDLCIVDEGKVATGEIIYAYLQFVGAEIDLEIARALYTAILSDSGGFRFHRTGSFTFRMAAHLVECGVDPVEIYSRLFEAGSQKQLKAWGKLLTRVNLDRELSWIVVDRQILKKYHLSIEEIDGLIDLMRKSNQASVFIVFVEKSEDEVLVGLRSKNGVNVGRFAATFGGGGHYHAAGFSAFKPLNQVVDETIRKLRKIS